MTAEGKVRKTLVGEGDDSGRTAAFVLQPHYTEESLTRQKLEEVKMRLSDEWREYHEANPQVYQLICKYAQDVIDRGFQKYAIATIWERMRWHLTIEVRSAHDFHLPNNHRAYYARYWLDQHPEHPKFFNIAVLRSEVGDEEFDRWGRLREDAGEEPDLFT